jgi:O-methyltransferase involved in polyketide biosynthesis
MSDLSVTALYTCGAWAWARLPGAALLDHEDARRVFAVTNAALGLAARGAPSVRHGLIQRHLMIDRVIAAAGVREVIELGAGLSPRGVALGATGVAVTEVDRPGVIARKRGLLSRTAEGREALARIALVEGDVASLDLTTLPRGAGPVAVVAEGLLMYLDGAAQAALFARVAAALAGRGGVLVFDLVPPAEQPPPGLGGRALSAVMRRFTGGADFVRAPRTRAEILADLAAAGLHAARAVSPAEAPAAWALPHLGERTQQVVFAAYASSSSSSSSSPPTGPSW